MALHEMQHLRLLFVRRGGDDEGIKVSGVSDVPGKPEILTTREWDLNPQSGEMSPEVGNHMTAFF